MEKVFQIDIPFKFVSLYLGALPLENVTSKDKYLFQILTAACRTTITRKWLKLERPMVDEWTDIVYDIFKIERIPLPFNILVYSDFCLLFQR